LSEPWQIHSKLSELFRLKPVCVHTGTLFLWTFNLELNPKIRKIKKAKLAKLNLTA